MRQMFRLQLPDMGAAERRCDAPAQTDARNDRCYCRRQRCKPDKCHCRAGWRRAVASVSALTAAAAALTQEPAKATGRARGSVRHTTAVGTESVPALGFCPACSPREEELKPRSLQLARSLARSFFSTKLYLYAKHRAHY